MGSTYYTGLVFVSNSITANVELIVIAGGIIYIYLFPFIFFTK